MTKRTLILDLYLKIAYPIQGSDILIDHGYFKNKINYANWHEYCCKYMYKWLLYSTLAISLKIGRWNLDCSGSYLLLTWSDEFTLLMQPSLNYIVILQTFSVKNAVLSVTPGEGIFISLSKIVYFLPKQCSLYVTHHH